MLATTFGIALEWQVKNGPFPGLSPENVRDLWDSGLKKNESRDTGEQLRWFIENMSTTKRLKKLEDKVIVATSEQKAILQAAEKGRMLSDQPTSLATVIPKRKRGGWDDNAKKKRSKLETVDAAINIMKGSSEKKLQAIHESNIKRGTRERKSENGSKITNNADKSSRVALGEITNKKLMIGNGEVNREMKMNGKKRKREEKCNNPIKIPISSKLQDENETTMKGTTQKEITTINLLSEDKNCENQDGSGSGRTCYHMKMPITQSLKEADLYTVSGYEQLVNSKCILAMVEIIHESSDREIISSTNTDLYSYLMKSEWAKAKNLLHPDANARRFAGGNWNTPKRTKATAMSSVLLIPCHDEAGNHWYLLARIKMPGGKHNVYIIDSMGIALARSRMKKIKDLLTAIHLMDETDECIPINVKRQTEQECGVRMMNYMMMFKECVNRNSEGQRIIRQMNRNIKSERQSTHELAKASRKKMCKILKRQKENVMG
jgi:hypothetical protein